MAEVKTWRGLISYALSTMGRPYMYGVNDWFITYPLIQSKTIQYPDNYSLIKIEWLKGFAKQNLTLPDADKIRGVQCNTFSTNYLGVSHSADGWYNSCIEKGDIDTIPEIIGLMVWQDGHMGIYLGDRKVVEARGGSIKRLADGTISAPNRKVMLTTLDEGRGWTNWGRLPLMSYEGASTDMIFCKKGDGQETATSSNQNVKSMQRGFLDLGIKMIKADGTEGTDDGRWGGGTTYGNQAFELKYGIPGDGLIFGDIHLRIMLAELSKLDTGITQADLDKEKANTASALARFEMVSTDMVVLTGAFDAKDHADQVIQGIRDKY